MVTLRKVGFSIAKTLRETSAPSTLGVHGGVFDKAQHQWVRLVGLERKRNSLREENRRPAEYKPETGVLLGGKSSRKWAGRLLKRKFAQP